MLYAFIVTIILGSLTEYIKDFFMIFLSISGIKLYKITSNIEINKIMKVIKINGSTINTNNKDSGIIWGKYFIGSLRTSDNEYDNNKLLFLLCTKKQYEIIKINKDKISDDENIEQIKEIIEDKDSNKIKEITYWSRSGSYRFIFYMSRPLYLTNIIKKDEQQTIVDSIYLNFLKKKHLVVNIYGEPGVGKSMIGFILSQKLECNYCDSWNPTDPNDNLDNIYNEINPDSSKPLILVLEEFDIIIQKINNNIQKHKEYHIQVTDKIGWNSLLDKIQIGIYPYLILILTSNKSPTDIDKQDPSLLRMGRVDFKYNLKSTKNE